MSDIKQLAGRHAPITMLGARTIPHLLRDVDLAINALTDRLAHEIKRGLGLRRLPVVMFRRIQDVDCIHVVFAYGVEVSYSLERDSDRITTESVCAALTWRLEDRLAALQGES